MRINPAVSDPTTVPTVLTEKTFPTEEPSVAASRVAMRLATGSVIPRKTVGMTIMRKQKRHSRDKKIGYTASVFASNVDRCQKMYGILP